MRPRDDCDLHLPCQYAFPGMKYLILTGNYIILKSRQGILTVTNGWNCWCSCPLAPHPTIKGRGGVIMIANFLSPGVLLIHTYIKLRFSGNILQLENGFHVISEEKSIACATQHVQWTSTFGQKWYEFKLISCFPLLLYGGATTRGCWTPNYLHDWTIVNNMKFKFRWRKWENMWINNIKISAINV